MIFSRISEHWAINSVARHDHYRKDRNNVFNPYSIHTAWWTSSMIFSGRTCFLNALIIPLHSKGDLAHRDV